MAAQKATELRRLVSEVAAERLRLKARQDELEKYLVAAPAANWSEAAEKARYLLTLFAATAEAQDPRRKTLIANLLDDFERLLYPSIIKRTRKRRQPRLNDHGKRPETHQQGTEEAEGRREEGEKASGAEISASVRDTADRQDHRREDRRESVTGHEDPNPVE